MSVSKDHSVQNTEALPQSGTAQNYTIHVPDVRTVKVGNVSLATAEKDIKEFFSFCGDIRYVEIRKESETTQCAYVTFKASQGPDTAVLLSGSTIAGHAVTITPVADYHLPPEAVIEANQEPKSPTASSAVQKAEDVVSSMLAKGYVLGKDAIDKAKAFDERIQLSSSASATVASIGRRMEGVGEKLSFGTAAVNEKVRAMDERFQVSEKTKAAFSVAEQKASSAGTAIMSNRFVSTGASWVSGAFSVVAKAAGDVSVMAKEKVEKAEEEKRETLVQSRQQIVTDLGNIHVDNVDDHDQASAAAAQSPAAQPPIVPVSSPDNKLAKI